MTPKSNSLYVLGAIVLIGFLMWFLGRQPSPSALEKEVSNNQEAEEVFDLGRDVTDALFTCDDRKAIGANFFEKGVVLNLSDGRTIQLPLAISASGVRYANSNESFVFWNKGDVAFIEESGQTTFANCREVQAEIE